MAWLIGSSVRESAMVAFGLVELRWRFLPKALFCFNFHRIGKASLSPFDRGVFSCDVSQFEEIVVLLKQRFEVIDLVRLLEIQDGVRHALDRPLALITFDDGYRDNFTEAVPILNRHGMRAVFFVTTSYVDSDAVPWWDEIAWCVRHARQRSIRLHGVPDPIELGNADRDLLVRSILRIAKSRRDTRMQDTVEEIRAACDAPPLVPIAGAQRLFVSWDNLRELVASGHAVGSHTLSHQVLARLPYDEQFVELEESKKRLEAELACPVHAVAYPVGGRGTFDARTCALAQQAGYRLGFSFLPGHDRLPLVNPWAIRRVAVSDLRSARSIKSRVGFPALG